MLHCFDNLTHTDESAMFLSDTQFQKMSGVTRQGYVAFSRVNTLLSTRPQQFSLNCCCATLRRSNYACLLRKIGLFRSFGAVVKSSAAAKKQTVSRFSFSTLSSNGSIYGENSCTSVENFYQLSACFRLLLGTFNWNCLCLHSEFCTQHCLLSLLFTFNFMS